MRASRHRPTVCATRGRPAVRTLAAAVLAGTLALVTACGGGNGGASWRGGSGQQAEAEPKASVTITGPANDSKDVPASTEITFDAKDASGATLELRDADGNVVEGELSADGTSWLPDGQLDYGTTYTATVTATGDDGKPVTATSTFTTMPKPDKQVAVSSFLGDGAVVGVGMVMIVKFGRAIPEDYRDDVQRRMTVRSDPPQEGIWHWISGTEVHYRPKTYWQPNTKILYKVQAGGLPLGDGWYGRNDLAVDVKTGAALFMAVDNKTKKMTVTKDGQVIKTIPISLGKPKTPSSSGTMIVMEKLKKTVFNTMNDPDPENRYVTDIEYAQRLTWGGEFIHAAPWSVADQGRRNVSHGCVNMSIENAKWLFGQTRVGDVITIKGTERKLQNGNGWTAWNMSWEEYVKGSALPYEPTATPASPPAA